MKNARNGTTDGEGPCAGTTGAQGVRLFHELLNGRSLASEYAKRGSVLTIFGRLEEARVEYGRALDIEPRHRDALNGLAHVLTAMGDDAAALGLLRRDAEAAAAQPSPVALNNCGNALLSQGDLPGAVASYRHAISVEPRYAMPHRNLALALYTLGSRDEAVAELRTYFTLSPPNLVDADGHYNLAVMLSEQRRHAEARLELERALVDRPDDPKALNNLGLTHFAEGRPELAIHWFECALAIDATFVLALFNLATALVATGRYADAIERYEQVMRLDSQHAQAASNLSALYTNDGRADEAIALLLPLVEQLPRVATFHLNLALAYERGGRIDEAREAWTAVIAAEPADSTRGRRARAAIERLGPP